MLTGFIQDGVLRLERNGQTLQASCNFSATPRCCSIACPHLDDSDDDCIHLTCGGTDVCVEKINPQKG